MAAKIYEREHVSPFTIGLKDCDEEERFIECNNSRKFQERLQSKPLHQKKSHMPDNDIDDIREGNSLSSEDDDADMQSERNMAPLHQIGKADSFALIKDAMSSGNFSHSGKLKLMDIDSNSS